MRPEKRVRYVRRAILGAGLLAAVSGYALIDHKDGLQKQQGMYQERPERTYQDGRLLTEQEKTIELLRRYYE